MMVEFEIILYIYKFVKIVGHWEAIRVLKVCTKLGIGQKKSSNQINNKGIKPESVSSIPSSPVTP